jgi:hypothetical protein
MAAIIWNTGEKSVIDAWLSGRGSAAAFGSPVTIPAGSGTVGSFGLGMGTRVGGVGSTKADVMAQILELGTSTAAGYARQGLTRDTTGWPAATLVTTSYQSTAPQQTFTFTGATTTTHCSVQTRQQPASSRTATRSASRPPIARPDPTGTDQTRRGQPSPRWRAGPFVYL